jgi:hypothetical protein
MLYQKTENMILENFLSFFFGIIMTFLLQRLFGGNKEFFKIIDEFKKKLPPKDKKAESKFNEKIGLQHMNLDTLKSNIETKDIDYFLKQLEDFDYNSVFFKREKIENYSKNIQRIIKTTKWELFSIGILQELLESKERNKNKPYLLGSKIAEYIKF